MKQAIVSIAVMGLAGTSIALTSGVAFADSYEPSAPPNINTSTTPVKVKGIEFTQQPPTAVTPTATLPFTGLDTVTVAGFGVVLVAGGVTLTIVSRKRRGHGAAE